MFDRVSGAVAGFVSRRPWPTLFIALVLAFVMGAQGMPDQGNDSAAFAPDAAAVEAAATIDALFDDGAAVSPLQIVVSGDDVVTLDGLAATRAAIEAIETAEVDGVLLADLLIDQPGTGSIISYLSPVEQAAAFGAPAPTTDAELKATLVAALDQLPPEAAGLVGGLYSTDADLTTATAGAGLVLAFVEAPVTLDDAALLAALETQVVDTLAAQSFEGLELGAFSLELVGAASDAAGIEIPILLGIAVLIIGLVLLVVYLPSRPRGWLARSRRSLADTGLTLAVALLAVIVSYGAAVLLGPDGLGIMGDLAGPSQIVPILLIGLGVDYVIHLNAAYRSGLGSRSVTEAAARSGRIVGGALFLSAATTILGFLTNLWSGIPALFDFGLLASVGIGAALVLALTLFPAVRVLLDRAAERRGRFVAEGLDSRESGLIDRVVSAAAVIPRRAAWTAIGGFTALLVAGAVAATGLQSGFSFLDFVPDDAEVRATALQLTDEFGGGLGESTNVLIEGDVADASVWNRMIEATTAAADVEGVVTVGGAALADTPAGVLLTLVASTPDLAAVAAQLGLDDDLLAPAGTSVEPLIAAALAADPGSLSGVLHVGPSGADAALVTLTTQAGTDGALALAEDLEGLYGPGAVATSLDILDAAIVEAISAIQVQSLLLALAAAAVVLAISFWRSDRSPVIGLITTIPVGVVVILLFGFMALAGIPFGPVTATLAAVVIGVGVDYTIHVAHRYRDLRREGLAIDDAMDETLATTGSALVTSGLTTAAGFAVLMASSLIPFQQFGVLTLVAVGGSAIVSVLLLPSMLVVWDRALERRRPVAVRRRDPQPGEA